MIIGSLLTPANILFVIGGVIIVYLMISYIKTYKELSTSDKLFDDGYEWVTQEDPNNEKYLYSIDINSIVEAMVSYIEGLDDVEEIVFQRVFRFITIKTSYGYEYLYYGFFSLDKDKKIIDKITLKFMDEYRVVHDFTPNNYGNGRCITLEEEII